MRRRLAAVAAAAAPALPLSVVGEPVHVYNNYFFHTLDDASAVKALVTAGAGVGKV